MREIQQRIAQIIRQVDGDHSLGAAALAEALVSELGLTREECPFMVDIVDGMPTTSIYRASRYVSEWVPE